MSTSTVFKRSTADFTAEEHFTQTAEGAVYARVRSNGPNGWRTSAWRRTELAGIPTDATPTEQRARVTSSRAARPLDTATSTIVGYSPGNLQTAKAVRITVTDVDGEEIGACDTTWLPRSIAIWLTVTERRYEDGGSWFEVRATVPTWWVRKLDNRPAWVRRGDRHAPFATRP